MAMYWLLLLSPSLFSALGLKRKTDTRIVFLALFALFAVAVGLREDVGMDWGNYLVLYESMGGMQFGLEDIAREPAFYLVNLMAYELGWGITFVNVVHALVFLFGLFYFAYRKCPDKFLALAVATPYLVVVVGMSGIRQAAAIGVFFYVLAVWDRAGNVAKMLLLILAASFHTSAILLVALIVIDRNKNPVRMLVAGVLAVTVGLFIMGPSHEYYVESYIDENLQSEGAVFHALLVVAPAAVYLILKKRFDRAGLYDPILYKMSILAIAIFPLLAISSTGVDRFLLYFTGIQLYVASALPFVFRSGAFRLLILLGNAVVLWTWLEFANNAEAWRTYTSCLTSPSGCFN